VRAIRLAAPFTASDATVPIRCPYTSAVIEIAAWPSSLDTTAMSAHGGEHERGGTVPQPVETHRGQLLTGAFAEALYAGRPFRAILRDLGLTSNQVWGSPEQTTHGTPSSRPLDRYPPGPPEARHDPGVCPWVCLPRVPRTPAHQDGQEPRLSAEHSQQR
jgi:hypothetical protein